MSFNNAWRDAAREIDAACRLRDLLPRRVVHGVYLEVYTMSHGDLCAVAALQGSPLTIDYAQGVLDDAEFPIFAARHIAQSYDALLRRAARAQQRQAS